MGGFAWVTLATNDSYSLGALVLAHSLKSVGTKHDLAVLITPGVTNIMREKLSNVFTIIQEVNVLDSKDEANLALLARPELGITFTKLHCWRLTQYKKCVFIDADALVIQNCDELFERDELSAAPDVGWPDCFNSGVFVFQPSQQTFASLTAFAASQGSFDGGDQGLLNSYFSDWAHKDISKHLPFIYNMCSTATYSYLPAYKQFGDDVRIIHFIGSTKPWLQYFDTLSGQVQPASGSGHLQPLLQHWWDIFCENVHPNLSPAMAGIAGALAKITLGETRSPEQVALEEHLRKYGWEQGKIDYMGRDSFDNIWKKISTTLEKPSTKQESTLTNEDAVTEVEEKPIVEDKIVAEILTTTVAEEVVAKDKKQDVTTVEKSLETAKEIPSTPTLALKAAPEVLSIKEYGEKSEEEKTFIDKKISKINKESTNLHLDSVIPLGFITTPSFFTESTEIPVQSSTSAPDSSVSIQVAETVLEADIKESVSEDIKPIIEEAISSISAPVQETISLVIAQSPPAVEASISGHANGNGGLDSDEKFNEDTKIVAQALPNRSAIQQQVESIQSIEDILIPKANISETQIKLESSTQNPSASTSTYQVPDEKSQIFVPEDTSKVPESITEVVAETLPIAEQALKTKFVALKDLEKIPEKPARTKDIKIPATPTVTEATPPTSPQFETTEEESQVLKKTDEKVVKNEESEVKPETSESGETKTTKKVVKKIIKKAKGTQDDAVEGTSTEKPKKVVKVVKKSTKASPSLEPDNSVPETPPPACSDIPIPPKRKAKPAATKTTKKSDPEQ